MGEQKVLDLMRLDDRVAIVTGAGKGLGKGLALALAEAGADIVCTARTVSDIEETTEQVRALGRKAIAIPTDVTSSQSVNEMCARAIAEFKKIDILVNNAGMSIFKPFADVTDEEWDLVINTNLRGAFYCTRGIAHHMIERRQGKVINVSSVMGVRGYQNFVSYCVTKGGIIQLTRALALEWARYNINVNAIAPGVIMTSLSDGIFADKGVRDLHMKRIPLKRFGVPEDFGTLLVFLASRASDLMTGEVVVMDGGQQVNW